MTVASAKYRASDPLNVGPIERTEGSFLCDKISRDSIRY